jgi:hypothetical protein
LNGDEYMAKEFTGSWIIVVILVCLCWPAALIYFIMKYKEVAPPMAPMAYPPPGYGAPPPVYGPAPPPAYGPPPPPQYYQPPPPR